MSGLTPQHTPVGWGPDDDELRGYIFGMDESSAVVLEIKIKRCYKAVTRLGLIPVEYPLHNLVKTGTKRPAKSHK